MTATETVHIRSDREGARVWTLGALDVIASDGVQALRIEPLARRVGVSKGSFYWFFRDMDDLKQQALLHWRDEMNAPVFAEVRAFVAPLEDRLSNLVEQVLAGRLGRYDGAIRGWALTDKAVERFVRDVDRTRLQFLEEVFDNSDPPLPDARMRAHLFYRVFIAESYVGTYPGTAQRAAFMKEVAQFLNTSRAGPSA